MVLLVQNTFAPVYRLDNQRQLFCFCEGVNIYLSTFMKGVNYIQSPKTEIN